MPDHAPVEITVFTKSGGPLTKRISITDDREIKSDGSACVMTEGEARRAPLADVAALGRLIEGLKSSQAIALGALRPDLPERVRVVTKRKLNGQANTIARTGGHISYRPGQPAWSLCDYDKKGMPAEVAIAVQQHGNYWSALCTVLPALKNVAHVLRRSTSAGLICGEAKLPGSGGQHGFVAVCDGTDIERFLRVLHERCWLAGYGWHMVGAGGQLLDRSIVDRMVGAPERLVFEGPPVLVPPLEQDAASRRPVAIAGNLLDTLASCPPLTVAETAALRELKARSAHRLAGDCAKSRTAFIGKQTERLIARGMGKQAATQTVASQCDGILLPAVVLPFDDEDLAGTTVADVLADPERFEGATLADPLEGIEYGLCKALIMRRADGTPWIHSFAHGRTVYQLKYSAAAVRTAIEQAEKSAAVETLIELAGMAELNAAELEELRDLAAERAGRTRRTVDKMLKAAAKEQATRRAWEEQQRKLAERRDPRPQIECPEPDAPWLPQMGLLNEIIGTAPQLRTRSVEGDSASVRLIDVATLHLFTHHEEPSP